MPFYGVTAGDVAQVELRYAEGSITAAPADTGGFVLISTQVTIRHNSWPRPRTGPFSRPSEPTDSLPVVMKAPAALSRA